MEKIPAMMVVQGYSRDFIIREMWISKLLHPLFFRSWTDPLQYSNRKVVVLLQVVLLIDFVRERSAQVLNDNSCGISAFDVGADCSYKQDILVEKRYRYVPQFKSRTRKGNLRHQLQVTPLNDFVARSAAKRIRASLPMVFLCWTNKR